MKVLLRNPRREVEFAGPMTVQALLRRLEVSPESVLVIVGDELVTHDVRLEDSASVEIRPVISGGDAAESTISHGDGAEALRHAPDDAAESTISGGDGA